MNRRELLKIFGAGAAIVPIVGGMPDESKRAIIVEPPKVKLVESIPPDASELIWGECDAVLYLKSRTSPVFVRKWEMQVDSIELHPTEIRKGVIHFSNRVGW